MYLVASLARLGSSGTNQIRLLKKFSSLNGFPKEQRQLLSRSETLCPCLGPVKHSNQICDNFSRPAVRDISFVSESILKRNRLLLAHNSTHSVPSRNLKIAATIVDRCPTNFQPFLKLSRLDKPIGRSMHHRVWCRSIGLTHRVVWQNFVNPWAINSVLIFWSVWLFQKGVSIVYIKMYCVFKHSSNRFWV